MERYFVVKLDLHPDFPFHAGMTFVKVSEGRLEFIEGNSSNLDVLKTKEGNLLVNERAVCKYNIAEINEGKLFLLRENYKDSLQRHRRRPHSYRGLNRC